MKNDFDILVVDDEQVVIDSIIKIGELNNYKLDSALDGNIALEKISVNKYSLIICDIMMPGMDGFQLITELQNRNVKTPIVITTGYSTLENAVKSLYQGAIDYIPKPFTIDEMTSVMKRGIKYQKLISEIEKSPGSIAFVPCPPKYFRLGYSCWVNNDYDGSYFLGATDIYLKTVEDLKNIELMDIGETVHQASVIARFRSADDTLHQLYSALSGIIIDRNEKLRNDISLLEKDPYFNGWLYRLIPSELDYEMKILTSCSSDRS